MKKFLLNALKRTKRYFVKIWDILYASVRKFIKEGHALQATVLTYYTLFAVVPILALLFGIAKGFNLDNKLKSFIAERFAEQQNIVDWMYRFADTTLNNANGGIIAGVGILVLFWTVIRLATYIENTFNQIWAIRKGRTFFRKISDYLSLLVIAPILLVVMSSSTIFAQRALQAMVHKLPGSDMLNFAEISMKIFPFLMAWLLFVFIYVFMPNTKVRMRSGIFAAVFAAILYQLAQMAYINIQLRLTGYNSIYGSFSALPLFLIWMQWSWTVTLLGAEIAFVHQNFYTGQFGKEQFAFSGRLRRMGVITLCKIVVDGFEKDDRYYSEGELAAKVNMPLVMVRSMLQEAVDCHLLQRVIVEKRNEIVFTPGVPTDKLTVIATWKILENAGYNQQQSDDVPEFAALEKEYMNFISALEKSPQNRLLREI